MIDNYKKELEAQFSKDKNKQVAEERLELID